MKKSVLSLLSLLLAVMMLAGVFASCTWGTPEDTPDNDSSTPDTDENESESGNGDEVEGPATPPDLSTMANGALISHANSLVNGVNAYFTDGKRTDFVLENQNMTLEYALTASKAQLVTSLSDKSGNNYITGTSDVFVKMTNGNVFYASNSTSPATANLYRFGYYMYEARFEEQNFMSALNYDEALTLSMAGLGKNQVKVVDNADGSVNAIISNTADPYIQLKKTNYKAEDYPFLLITMKSNAKSVRGLAVYLSTDTHSMGYATGVTVSPTSDYVTYVVPLFRTEWYTGTVTNVRLDFEGASQVGDSYDIKEFRVVNGNTEGIPEALGLNRSYFVYSDKLHHVIQIATAKVATENIASVGMETKIAKSTVAKLIVKDKNGNHTSLSDVDWDSAECVGFDINGAGIFGYILPAGEKTDKLEVIEDGENYIVIQSRTPEGGTIQPSGTWNSDIGKYEALVDNNANDFYMGQRIYTDSNHDFEKFLLEAHIERNPLGDQNIVINKRDSSYDADYECPLCGKMYEDYVNTCTDCDENIKPIEHENMFFKGYDPLRGIYVVQVPGESFNAPYFQYPNKYINATVLIKGDDYDRDIYFMTYATSGCLECAAILDENKLMLPVPIEVGKNFSEGSGERNLWNIQDSTYSEAIIPMKISAKSSQIYSVLNLYQNWGQYPLKQVSWIQFYAPYYHLSTGVTESNCIVPYYSCKNARGLGTLPDHRAMSAHLWSGQPQHTSGGSHRWLMYTDADGVYSASENTLDYIDSYGPIYADVYMDYLSDDGKIKVSYTHMEFPQTDENRAYYEMKYEVLDDVSFTDFSRDFCFYDVSDNDAKGSYISVGYLNENNESVIVDAAKGSESYKYVLGDNCPYFSFFNMPDYDVNSTSAEGFTNLSFLIHSYDIVINGQKSDAHFVIVNEDNRVRLSLDLGSVTLKKGDTVTINAIVMPWGDEKLNYAVVGDKNVRDVRVNTLLNPLTVTAVENCETVESVFLPRVKSTNGKNATFTLKGGQNNVAVRVYGLCTLTAPKIQELVDGQWVDYQVSSAYKPDRFGNAFYYDGYSVHYDEDGTFSYAFIVPMDYTDTDGRTFRFSASEEFTEWPKRLPVIETEEEDLPMNVFTDALGIMTEAQNQAGKMFGGIEMSDDGTYVTLSSNSKKQEAYFNIWQGNGGKTVTGQYFVLKYRLPETNTRKHNYFEIFTSTAGYDKACFGISRAFINDGQWHTLVIDLGSWESSVFKPDENGDYKAVSVRVDFFNEYYADGNSIDLEFFGMCDSLETILAYEKVESINVFVKGGSVTSYDKDLNEIPTPSDTAASTAVEGFNLYLSATAIADAANSDDGHIGKTVLSEDGKYVSLYNHAQRLESYITLFSGNKLPTGQYLVVKYRTAKQAGSIEFYCGTEAEGAKSGLNFNLNHNKNYAFAADGEWHTVVVDLSKVIKNDQFITNDAGEYIAKFIRIDLFNFDSVKEAEYWVDIAFVGFCDDYDKAVTREENTWFYDGEKSIDVSTGEPLTPPTGGNQGGTQGGVEDATSSVPGFNVYIDPTKLAAAGKNTYWKDVITTSADGTYTTFANPVNADTDARKNEIYITVFSSAEGKATGQYAVIKYKANVQQGSITIWSSTENSGASGSNYVDLNAGNGLFIADNEWHIIVVDLSKFIPTYTQKNGKYSATHLRLDFFNYDKPRNPADTLAIIDVAYVGLCDDFTEIITKDKSVAELVFYDGDTYKYSTATGEVTSAPEGGNPDSGNTPDSDYTFIYNASDIYSASQIGGGHVGDEELIEDGSVARIYNCIDSSKTDAARMESYFSLLSKNTSVTGQYLVIKYRATKQVGSIQIYTSTQNASAGSSGTKSLYAAGGSGNGMFIADGEWKIVVIDLSKSIGTYTPNADGEYVATHLRIDLFNFSSPSTGSEAAYVDLAYIGLCKDYTAILGDDDDVENIIFFDGTTQSIANKAQ